VLDGDGIAFFKRQLSGRLPKAAMFTEDGEQPWRRHMWCRRIREAIATHNKDAERADLLPIGASAYSFRHARISELLQVRGVDPLTVAKQTGTSLPMLELAYFKLIPNTLREKMSAVKDTQ
jgi:hypothetical protein